MSALTSNDVYGLMEAYQAVYAPQELTEEQVWEEVEIWVNDLLEEGYDLSDYTWEEMFEAYIEEQGRNTTPQAVIDRNRAALGNTLGRLGNRIMTGNPEGTRAPIRQTPNRRGAARTPTPTFQNTGGYGRYGAPGTQVTTPKPTATPAPPKPAPAATATPAAPRPAAPAPATRPAAAPAKPAGTAPAPKPPATTTPAPATPSAPAKPSLSSQVSDLQKMRARSLERQGKPVAAATVAASTKPAFQANSFDVFDAIKGHLLDEGYADTEEAALMIMANMSKEWGESIVVEAGVANRDPYEYERNERKNETRGQRAERKVRGRLETMDPEKRKKMIAQMRAVGLNV